MKENSIVAVSSVGYAVARRRLRAPPPLLPQNLLFAKHPRLTGSSLPDAEFRIDEAHVTVPPQALRQLLEGRLAGLIVRQALSEEWCDHVATQFAASPARVVREDGIPGSYLGALQFGRSFEEYFADVEATRDELDRVLRGRGEAVDIVLAAARAAYADEFASVRPARWRGRAAALARVQNWAGRDEYLLPPHEDKAQLTDPRQTDFEIAGAFECPVLAVNAYPSTPTHGTELRLWNIEPDAAARSAFGTSVTGYPYPTGALEAFPALDIAIDARSLVIVNGGLIHGVPAVDKNARGSDRLLVNFFLSRLTRDSIIHWV